MEQEGRGREGRIHIPSLPHCMSWDISVLSPLDWDLTHQLFWESGLQIVDRGISWPSESNELIPLPQINFQASFSPFHLFPDSNQYHIYSQFSASALLAQYLQTSVR